MTGTEKTEKVVVTPDMSSEDLVAAVLKTFGCFEPWTQWVGHGDIYVCGPDGPKENSSSYFRGIVAKIAEIDDEAGFKLLQHAVGKAETFAVISGLGEEDEFVVEVSDQIRNALARRVVACINACAGMPIERLEQLRPGDLMASLQKPQTLPKGATD